MVFVISNQYYTIIISSPTSTCPKNEELKLYVKCTVLEVDEEAATCTVDFGNIKRFAVPLGDLKAPVESRHAHV